MSAVSGERGGLRVDVLLHVISWTAAGGLPRSGDLLVACFRSASGGLEMLENGRIIFFGLQYCTVLYENDPDVI
jgi:hypothetical protein